jgi:tRNA A37 threonylcarbamoyladenosine modification protein TsaB
VRIAIAAAMGLQSVFGCELVGLPSVLALAPPEATFQAIGDARRGTWYYTQIRQGVCVNGPLLLGTPEELQAALASGDGPVVSSENLPAEWGAELRVPQAETLARLARIDRGVCQRETLEPLYLRPPHITGPAAR